MIGKILSYHLALSNDGTKGGQATKPIIRSCEKAL